MNQLPTDFWGLLGEIVQNLAQILTALGVIYGLWQNRNQLQKQDVLASNQEGLHKQLNSLTDARVKAAEDKGAMDEQRRVEMKRMREES